MKISRVLLPTDFSDCGNSALPTALEWAGLHGAEIDMLHAVVLYDFELPADAGAPADAQILQAYRETTEKALSKLGSDPLVIRRVQRRDTSAATAIVEYASEAGSDLIVMATHGRRGPRRLILGSTTEEVVRHSPCPVLAVHCSDVASSGADGPILVPVDFSPASATTIAAAADLANLLGAAVRLIHVLEEPTFPLFYESLPDASLMDLPALDRASREQLEVLWQENGSDQVEASFRVERGYPSEIILSASDALSARLIVMPTRGLGVVAHLLLGSVAEKVLRGAHCPVLILPERESD